MEFCGKVVGNRRHARRLNTRRVVLRVKAIENSPIGLVACANKFVTDSTIASATMAKINSTPCMYGGLVWGPSNNCARTSSRFKIPATPARLCHLQFAVFIRRRRIGSDNENHPRPFRSKIWSRESIHVRRLKTKERNRIRRYLQDDWIRARISKLRVEKGVYLMSNPSPWRSRIGLFCDPVFRLDVVNNPSVFTPLNINCL